MKNKFRTQARRWLGKEKNVLAVELAKCGEFIPRIKQDIDENSNSFEEYSIREVACLVDYMKFYFSCKTEDNKFRSLYIGERLKMAYDEYCSAQERNDRLIEFMRRDKEVFAQKLCYENDKLKSMFSDFFVTIIDEFNTPIRKELRVLFIGDCLHQDVMGTLSVSIMKHGVALSPHIISTKNIFQLFTELDKLKEQKFDAIFYSPFSYEYNIAFSRLLHYRNIFIDRFELAELLADILGEIEKLLDKILSIFSCPVFVHNSASIIRDESHYKQMAKLFLTKRLRKTATKYVDKKLKIFIANRNSARFKQLFLIDELHLLNKYTEKELGKYIYRSALQHPTNFGVLLADEYNIKLLMLANLYGKKIVVCDLDNTLWNGVIGEGAVNHFLARQNILLKLKEKGILLAVNSKNDPKNINWTGGALSDDDFVYKAVSWEPKINAFPKMASVLNLKLKDFVFIDDRPDEIEIVNSVYPSIQCLDALSSDTWRQLDVWEETFDDANVMDRTQMYREREHRSEFLNSINKSIIDEAEIFKNLGLVLSLREVKSSELKRTVELINRTNQFNMRASRTSFNEVQQWLNLENITVIQARMSDKFGDMGIVSIIVFEKKGSCIEILVFVLSCRVFGYKVEVAILNEVKRQAQQEGVEEIRGEYIKTASNQPCSLVYLEAQFRKEDDYWVFPMSGVAEFNNPEWLKVQHFRDAKINKVNDESNTT